MLNFKSHNHKKKAQGHTHKNNQSQTTHTHTIIEKITVYGIRNLFNTYILTQDKKRKTL